MEKGRKWENVRSSKRMMGKRGKSARKRIGMTGEIEEAVVSFRSFLRPCNGSP